MPLVVAGVTIALLWCAHQWNSPIWLLAIIGCGLFVGLSYVVWRVARRLTEHGFKFSLRGMLIGVAVMALLLSTVGRWLLSTYRQHLAVHVVRTHGGDLDDGVGSDDERTMLHSWMGYDPFAPIVDLKVTTDQALRAAIDHLDQFADITILRFRRGVTAVGFAHAGELNKFSELGLGEFMDSPIDDQGLEHLAKWTNVRDLFFNSCPNVTDAGLRHLVDLPKLESLSLIEEGGGMVITDAGLQHVGRMEQLRCLWLLNMPQITDAGLAHLHGLTRLKRIMIRRTGVTGEGLKQFYKALPDCHVVSDVFVPGAAEVQRVVVWKVGPPDEQVNVVSDPERIGKMRALLETSKERQQQFERRLNDPWPATYYLQFMGRSRVLYEVRLGDGTMQQNVGKPANDYPDLWAKWGISESEEAHFIELLMATGDD
ncbi:MAG: hypothetical protein L0228_20055 [Planctomycetes bacterium]|nr:hypothetical protein [Planctomycetota bacterium]